MHTNWVEVLGSVPKAEFVTLGEITPTIISFETTARMARAQRVGGWLSWSLFIGMWIVVIGVGIRNQSASALWLIPVAAGATWGIVKSLLRRASPRTIARIDLRRGEVVLPELSNQTFSLAGCSLWVHHASCDDPLAPEDPLVEFSHEMGWDLDLQHPKGSTAIYSTAAPTTVCRLATALYRAAGWKHGNMDGWKQFYDRDPFEEPDGR